MLLYKLKFKILINSGINICCLEHGSKTYLLGCHTYTKSRIRFRMRSQMLN
ncbi:protein HAIKU1-like [Iris pallida]|uniref:Protein HAIKU1-like n=1 Tax=Iris pallida TaxID=29817 RepID=A0AAX6FN49_IRIPA|nr:protein HAIKU1-like [Iris pallida]KAJ6832456.1 protein HAIKU1-like [Iris pallida]KAJ6835420.1 protein HAIKU1-like [Iris pallida]